MVDTVTIVGDPHITHKSLDKAVQLFEIVEKIGNPTIWLGDFLDTKEVIRGKCLNLIFEYFKSSKLDHIVLIGNHDWFNLECSDHSLKPLSSLPNVRIIDYPCAHPSLPFVFFPYIHDKDKLKQAISSFSDPTKAAFGHFDVSGYDYGNGHICEEGLNHQDFQNFKMVISGHFHKLQQTGNFTYLGTPFSHSFGESNQDKAIGIYNFKTNNLELIPTPFPRHVSIDIDLNKRGYYSKLESFLLGNVSNIIRVRLFGKAEEVISFNKSQYSRFNIKWEDKSHSEFDASINLDESLDNKSQFMEWANNIKKINSETVKLGLSILETVGAK